MIILSLDDVLVLPSSKYHLHTIQYIKDLDPSYIIYLAKNLRNQQIKESIIEDCIETLNNNVIKAQEKEQREDRWFSS